MDEISDWPGWVWVPPYTRHWHGRRRRVPGHWRALPRQLAFAL